MPTRNRGGAGMRSRTTGPAAAAGAAIDRSDPIRPVARADSRTAPGQRHRPLRPIPDPRQSKAGRGLLVLTLVAAIGMWYVSPREQPFTPRVARGGPGHRWLWGGSRQWPI